jgi:hypothetical protein
MLSLKLYIADIFSKITLFILNMLDCKLILNNKQKLNKN